MTADLEALAKELGPTLTAVEAARVLGLSPRTLANRRCRGEAPRYLKAGSRIIYPRAALLEFLGAKPAPPAEEPDQ